MKSKLFIIAFFCVSAAIFSQGTLQNENSLKNKFDNIYNTSSNYEVYKVISKERFLALKTTVLDSVKFMKEIILTKETLLKTEKATLDELNTSIRETKETLKNITEKQNNISLFGAMVSKVFYNFIVSGIIALLIGVLLFFVYRFKNADVVTQEAINNLTEVEKEFDKYRKKTLLNEQKLRRQIQDEINKQRKL
jgi:tetrahydromethanopterin S-methyltransferase subunit B